MADTIRIGSTEPAPVALPDGNGGEVEYVMDPVVKSVAEKVAKLQTTLTADESLSENDPKVIENIGEQLDVLLKPKPGSGAKVPKPSALIREAWEADKITTPALFTFVADLRASQYPT